MSRVLQLSLIHIYNTAEPADAFLSGMQDPVTSQPQADVYQDMKEVHYLEPKQPQQTEAFVPLESRVETSVVETSAPEVTLHMDTQPACASQELAPAQELEQSDSDKFDAVPPKLPWNDNMDAAEEPTVIPTPNLQSTGVPRPKAVPPKAPQTATEATVVGQELAKKQKEQEKQAVQQPDVYKRQFDDSQKQRGGSRRSSCFRRDQGDLEFCTCGFEGSKRSAG